MANPLEDHFDSLQDAYDLADTIADLERKGEFIREEIIRREFRKFRDKAREQRDSNKPRDWTYTHDTRLLSHIRWVIETYWEGKEYSKAPTKQLVIEKLRDRGLSKSEAEAVDLVTRHDSRRSPGR